MVVVDAPVQPAQVVVSEANDMPLTLDEFLKLDDDRLEIIEGKLVKMTAAGMVHQLIARNIQRHLDAYVLTHEGGEIFADGLTYLMFSDAKRLKDSYVPNVSYIRTENIIAMLDFTKPYPGVPDLAIEIVSPGNDAQEIIRKVTTYLEKGTEQVLLAYPALKQVHHYIRGKSEARIYSGSEKLDLEAFFPGLELTLAMIFKLPDWVMMQQPSSDEPAANP